MVITWNKFIILWWIGLFKLFGYLLIFHSNYSNPKISYSFQPLYIAIKDYFTIYLDCTFVSFVLEVVHLVASEKQITGLMIMAMQSSDMHFWLILSICLAKPNLAGQIYCTLAVETSLSKWMSGQISVLVKSNGSMIVL